MIDFIVGFLTNRWPEILGILITLSTGVIIPWLSRKSSNYKRIDKRLILYSLLHLVYLSIVPTIVMIAAMYLLVFLITSGVTFHLWSIIVYYIGTAVVSFLLFLLVVMRISKRMKILMGKAKQARMGIYPMLHCTAATSIVMTLVIVFFVGSPQEDIINRVMLILGWINQIWWLFLIISIIWRTSEYVYSTIKITMLDGEILHFDCSPKVCRVYRNYIRIMKRDENDVVIQELQINEVAIKQIEYLKQLDNQEQTIE